MGFLTQGVRGPLSLAEIRILHEIAAAKAQTSTEISDSINADPGFLSRVLARFEKTGYIVRKRMLHDARQLKITLTPKGRKVYDAWAKASETYIRGVLDTLDADAQKKLVECLETVTAILGDVKSSAPLSDSSEVEG